jgi:tRNA 2-thiouridine synthesizing protein A
MPELLDCKGLRCPQPVLKLAIRAKQVPAGTTLEIQADCPTFSDDVTKWCADSGKVLVSVVDRGAYRVATVQL